MDYGATDKQFEGDKDLKSLKKVSGFVQIPSLLSNY